MSNKQEKPALMRRNDPECYVSGWNYKLISELGEISYNNFPTEIYTFTLDNEYCCECELRFLDGILLNPQDYYEFLAIPMGRQDYASFKGLTEDEAAENLRWFEEHKDCLFQSPIQ